MRDFCNNIGLANMLSAAVVSATATTAAFDLQGFNAATVLCNTGAIASAGDFSLKLQESDTTTSGDFTDVVARDLIVPTAIPATLTADSIYKIGYKGAKRYIRAVLTKNGGTSLAAGLTLLKAHAASSPVA